MPASIIVANWREKICSDFGLTFLKPTVEYVASSSPTWLSFVGEEPTRAV